MIVIHIREHINIKDNEIQHVAENEETNGEQ